MEGETCQHWYPLMGRQTNANENQGDILVIMSFMVIIFLRVLREIFPIKRKTLIN